MSRNQIIHWLFFIIFLLSSILRFSLALVNREANDDHLEVARLIMQEKHLPGIDDCQECFQPKLFHYLVANIFKAINIPIEDITTQTIISQFLNAFLGTILILIVWIFLRAISVESTWLMLLAFSLTAFNPSLVGTNGQTTNDTLAILLATLALYFAWLYLRTELGRYYLICIVFTALGIATKTNIFIVAFAILFALFVKAFYQGQRPVLYFGALFLPIIVVLSFLNPVTQYLTNYQEYGTIVGMNLPKQPFPAFFEKSFVARPGITSIQDGLFTFKYVSLLKYPQLTNEVEDYPPHRTSLWTQIYGRANSIHFDNWPNSWSTKRNENFWLARTIYLIALVPTAMLVVGAGISGVELLAALLKHATSSLAVADYGLFDVIFWGYIAFIVSYSLQFRDFSVMKAIFIYPALLSFSVMFIKSGTVIYNFLQGNVWFPRFLSFWVTALLIFYIIDIFTLITHLYSLL